MVDEVQEDPRHKSLREAVIEQLLRGVNPDFDSESSKRDAEKAYRDFILAEAKRIDWFQDCVNLVIDDRSDSAFAHDFQHVKVDGPNDYRQCTRCGLRRYYGFY